ncbi:MAG: fluoride efflux transporter CrcB [Wenzhouxiangellaceae bacterium]
MYSLNVWLFLGLAGAAGAMSRFGLVAGLQHGLSIGVPYGTLLVNIVGCAGAGALWALLDRHQYLDSELRLILLVGYFGAFTTFSTFALETVALLRQEQWLIASLNLLLHNALGIIALLMGVAVVKASA